MSEQEADKLSLDILRQGMEEIARQIGELRNGQEETRRTLLKHLEEPDAHHPGVMAKQ